MTSISRPRSLREPFAVLPLLVLIPAVAAAVTAVFLPVEGWVVLCTALTAAVAAAILPHATFAAMLIAVVWAPNSAVTPIAVVAATLGLVLTTARPSAHAFHWLLVPLGAFAILSALHLQLALAPWETIARFDVPGLGLPLPAVSSYEVLAFSQWLMLPALVLAATRLAGDDAFADWFERGLLVAALVPIVMGLRDRLSGITVERAGYDAIQSIYVHPNQLAVFMAALVPLLAAIAARPGAPARRVFAAGLTLGAAVCLFLTFTRSTWIGLVLAVALTAVIGGYGRQLMVAGAVALVLAFASGVGATVVGRFADLTTAGQTADTDSFTWRLITWERVLEATPPFQLTGSGFGTYPRRTVEVFGMQNPNMGVDLQEDWRQGFGAHNDLLSVYVEQGLAGIALWLGFLGALVALAWRTVRRARTPLALGAFAAVITTVVSSASDNVASYGGYTLAAVAVIAATSRRERSAERSKPHPAEQQDREAASAR